MTNVAKLHDIQKIDSNWEKIRKRLMQLQALAAEPEELRSARATHAETDRDLTAQNARQRDAELEGRSLDDRIRSSETKLMSGTVRNPKELESLQHSIEAMRRQRAQIEETAVEAMLLGEELSKQSQREARELARQETQWAQRHGEYAQEEVKLKRMALQLKSQRSALVASLPEADTALYEDLRRRRGGIAVAMIDNGLCSACHVRVPTGVASTARSGGEAYCTSCGRLLAV